MSLPEPRDGKCQVKGCDNRALDRCSGCGINMCSYHTSRSGNRFSYHTQHRGAQGYDCGDLFCWGCAEGIYLGLKGEVLTSSEGQTKTVITSKKLPGVILERSADIHGVQEA